MSDIVERLQSENDNLLATTIRLRQKNRRLADEIERLRSKVTNLRAENELFLDKLHYMRNRASMIVSDYDDIQKDHLATRSDAQGQVHNDQD